MVLLAGPEAATDVGARLAALETQIIANAAEIGKLTTSVKILWRCCLALAGTSTAVTVYEIVAALTGG